jgi:TPR repeat protein
MLGYMLAQVRFGVMYMQDIPGRKDFYRAAVFFRWAAAQGGAIGQYELAVSSWNSFFSGGVFFRFAGDGWQCIV